MCVNYAEEIKSHCNEYYDIKELGTINAIIFVEQKWCLSSNFNILSSKHTKCKPVCGEFSGPKIVI